VTPEQLYTRIDKLEATARHLQQQQDDNHNLLKNWIASLQERIKTLEGR
jgi:hypothetical protein